MKAVATIYKGYAYLINRKSGKLGRRIGKRGAILATVAGRFMIIVYRGGIAHCYNLPSGVGRGRIGQRGVVNVDADGENVALSYRDRAPEVYDAETRKLLSKIETPDPIEGKFKDYLERVADDSDDLSDLCL